MGLVDTFMIARGPVGARLANEPAEIEAAISAQLAAGRSAWPEFALAPDDFARHLGTVVASEASPVQALAGLYAADLYLACACAGGDATALRALDIHYLQPTLAALSAHRTTADRDEELGQALRMRLLVAEPGATPRIAAYSGRAPLLSWLRTVTSRLAFDLHRQGQRIGPADDVDLSRLRAAGPDPELDYLKRLYSAELGRALVETLAGLSVREANMVRLHYLDGMSMEAIASLFRISRRTVHRSITRSRREIFDKTRALLSERLDISQSEFDTIMGLARSQLDRNLQELFAAEERIAERGSG
jgi:RNA polymerase sigma-70 factor (ECF subfamily)